MSVDSQLKARLEESFRRQQRLVLWCKLGTCWTGAAAVGFGLVFLERQTGWTSWLTLPIVALLGTLAATVLVLRHLKQQADWHKLAGRIEALHPELEGKLLTAIQQEPVKGCELNYLQRRVIEEALRHDQQRDWSASVPRSRLIIAQSAHWLALVLFAITLLGLRNTSGTALLARHLASNVSVTPGDADVERGSALVVLARFGGRLPPSVHLVEEQSGATSRIPLVKSLGDPMFGVSIPEVNSNLTYHIEYAGERTRDFQVTVFEHPRLERADVTVTYPDYTGLPTKRVEDTHRVSAVEGSHLDLSLRLNKPVASARLVSKVKDEKVVTLTVSPGQASASLAQLPLEANQAYDLQLVDAEGRTNKVPAQFVFEALKNRTPEIRVSSPKGDLRPSSLEEISFEGTVWDDFGVPAFGLGYMVGGREAQFIELGQSIPAQEKRPFHHLLRLEELGVQPDQAISWFVWADDIGPGGKIRRTTGDLFFGEVRPFDEVFREGQSMDNQSQKGEQSGGMDRAAKLADLQKQIISATWKLQRDSRTAPGRTRGQDSSSLEKAPMTGLAFSNPDDTPGVDLLKNTGTQIQAIQPIANLRHFPAAAPFGHFFGQPASDSEQQPPIGAGSPKAESKTKLAPRSTTPTLQDDIGVVHESELQALEQANTALQNQRDPRAAALWREAIKNMEQAIAQLKNAGKSPTLLKDALAAEQAAYQNLLKLQAHEYQVARSRNQSQGNSRNQQMEQQLEQLDLTQSEDRYETQREAQRPQSARREQLQIMNRLQELARRQQDLNDRLKELQTALQEARTEDERAEIKRRLKRLQEEERQMLADVDELRQRMDRPENQSQMAEQRRQLDQTREEVQRAAQAAGQDAASQALAAGTRAQRQFQQLRDQLRKENSSQFADDMREMRSQARELARQQEDILKNFQNENATDRKSLTDAGEHQQTLDKLARQNEVTTNLLQRATQVSQQAESSEPLLASQLYDTVRKFTQQSGKDVKQTTDELLNRGLMTRSLYDRLKDNTAQDATKMQDITSEMFRLGNLPQATEAGERARANIQSLKEGVEHAAESVLGDDTEALRLAQQELNQLTDELQREMGRERTNTNSTNSLSGLGAYSNAFSGETNRNIAGRPGNRDQQLAQAGSGPNRAQTGASAEASEPGQNPQRTGRDGQTAEQQNGSPKQNQSASNQDTENPGQIQESQPGQATPGKSGNAGGRQLAQANGNGTTGRQPRQPGMRGGEPAGGTAAGGGGGTPGDWNLDRLLSSDTWQQTGPLTGEDFVPWSDRLREVEEMLDAPDLRNEVATARERARVVRQDFKRDGKKPDWAVVQLQVMKPLTQVRDSIADELARRQSRDALVPIDRDPVPNRYSELVRRYYEELGKSK